MFHNKPFGGRAHGILDCVAAVFILLFATTSLVTGISLGVVTLTFGPAHRIGWLLLGNVLGAGLILYAWRWWTQQKREWPVPQEAAQQAAAPDGRA